MSTNDILKKAVSKLDGWANLLTGFGVEGTDRTKSTKMYSGTYLAEQEQIGLYSGDGFGARVVNLPVKEMTRKGFVIEGDADGVIVNDFKKRGFDKKIRELLRWSKVYGGAVAVMVIDDGNTLEIPLNYNTIKKIEEIKIYHRWRVDATIGKDNNVNSETYGELLTYTINPNEGAPYIVHKSRVLFLDGLDLPIDEKIKNNGWGMSVYQNTQPEIKRLSTVFGIVESIMDEFETSTITIEGLQELISTGQESVVKARLNLLDLSKHVINTRLLDAREKFEKSSSTVTGISDIIDRYAQALSAVTGIPITLLMGVSPAGLNATGQSDTRFWYDNIAADQEDMLLPQLNILINIMMLEKEGVLKGIPLKDWNIIFNPLWQMSEKEKADNRKITAETDQIYIQTGVLTPEEVAVSRFGNDKYSTETEIDIESRENPKINPEDDSEDDPEENI